MRITPEKITIEDIKRKDIFVFGSNLAGIHGAGAAKFAYDYGLAVFGKGIGLYVRQREGIGSWAIPTKGMRIENIPFDFVKYFVEYFIEDIEPELRYYVTPIGCGLAGFKPEEIAPLFKPCLKMDNVWLPEPFLEILK